MNVHKIKGIHMLNKNWLQEEGIDKFNTVYIAKVVVLLG